MRGRSALAGLSVALLSISAAWADPRCAGPENWPASMTFARLKNEGVLANDQVDFRRTSVHQIASQKIGHDLYRQVFEITFHLQAGYPKAGKPVRAIAVSDASMDECSMSDVTVYRIDEPSPR